MICTWIPAPSAAAQGFIIITHFLIPWSVETEIPGIREVRCIAKNYGVSLEDVTAMPDRDFVVRDNNSV